MRQRRPHEPILWWLISDLDRAAESAAAWNDNTRGEFDKRYVEPLGQKVQAYEAALAALQDTLAETARFIDSLPDQ